MLLFHGQLKNLHPRYGTETFRLQKLKAMRLKLKTRINPMIKKLKQTQMPNYKHLMNATTNPKVVFYNG